MKVCLLNDSFPPVIDGVVNVMMNYADHLMRDHGAEVLVGTPRYPDADYAAYPYPVVPYRSLDTAAITNGYRTGIPFEEKAVSEMARFAPDVIHTHCPASATVIARLLREETGAPVIFTYHTKYDIDIRRAVKSELIAEEGIKAMISNIEACDDVWVVSRGAGESLSALGYTGKWHVMNNGVDFAKGRVDDAAVRAATAGYDLPEDLPLFLYVGRLMNYKNIPLILDALRILDDAGYDFRMVFVGKGPDGDAIRAKAAELGLYENETRPDKCIFTGPIYERDVLRAWNTRADLFIFPSTFDTNGLVVREAAACGLASVLVEGSCAAEGITDGRNGFLIEETAEALAAGLMAVCFGGGAVSASGEGGSSADLFRDRRACLREAGQHAMDEIYESWETCVAAAHRRYEFVLAEKKEGVLPVRKLELTDHLLKFAARGMSGRDRLRRVGQDWMHDVRETASGMMENIAEAEERADSFYSAIRTAAQQSPGELYETVKEKAERKMDVLADRMEEYLTEESRAMTDNYWEDMAGQLRRQMQDYWK